MNYFGGVRFFFWAFQSSIPEVWLSISMAFPVCWSFLQSSERLRLWEPVIWCEVEDFSGLAAWRPLVILARFGRCFLERTEVTMGVFFFNNLSIYLSICLSIYLSIHPSIHPSIAIYLFLCCLSLGSVGGSNADILVIWSIEGISGTVTSHISPRIPWPRRTRLWTLKPERGGMIIGSTLTWPVPAWEKRSSW